MKKYGLFNMFNKNILWGGFLSLLLLGCDKNLSDRDIKTKDDLATEEETLSYVLGVYFGSQSKLFDSLDLDVLMAGFKNSYYAETDEELIFNDEEIRNVIVESQQKALSKAGEKSLEAGQKFLAENAKNEEYTVLDNGIQYKTIKEGDGDMPSIDDTVEVHYKGTLISGEEFDSSYQRNQTSVFPLNGVIVGWQHILPLMKTGSTWQVVIPPELAYGERGSGRIGPNEVLIFEINLIAIKDK